MSNLKIKHFNWTVIGSGPCGVATIGRLVDIKDNKSLDSELVGKLTWIDPSFTVGRMGQYYRNVPANTLNKVIFDLYYA